MCISAAETLSGELFQEWRRRYGLTIIEGLGSTEVLHIYLSNTPAQQKPGASGKRVPGYELRLTDPEGRAIAPGESGVLWVRGHSQSPCYWNRPDKTAETMRDDWIYTGDRFRVVPERCRGPVVRDRVWADNSVPRAQGAAGGGRGERLRDRAIAVSRGRPAHACGIGSRMAGRVRRTARSRASR